MHSQTIISLQAANEESSTTAQITPCARTRDGAFISLPDFSNKPRGMLSRIIVFESLSRLFRGGINRRTLVVGPKQPWNTDSRGQTTPIARTRPEKLTFFCGSRLFIRSAGIPTLSVVLSLFRRMLVLDTEVNEFNACRVVFSTLPNVDGVN